MKQSYLLLIKFFVLCILLVAGCSDDTEEVLEVLAQNQQLQAALAAPTEWAWVDNENIISRDGSSGGYAVNFSPGSTKLLIYLPGGRACFDAFSCGGNEPNYSEEKFFNNNDGSRALFNRSVRATNQENLFKDWHQIFIAYSSGDVYSGNNENVDVKNGGDQNQIFKGIQNFATALSEIISFLNEQNIDVTDVVLAGSSAGGYGVLGNFDQMVTILSGVYDEVQFTLINDAGYLLLDESVVPSCLNTDWQETFNIQVPDDLLQFTSTSYDFQFLGIYEYLSNKYPESNFGFYGSYSDLTSRTLLSLGQNECNYQVGLIDPEVFKQGLLVQQADLLSSLPNWKVYYRQTENHTLLPAQDYTSAEVKGVKFIKWVNDLHNGNAVDIIDE
ncbi:MAG: pectin acetylesterase-family hydrolase [Bacteroidota bacterium]